MDRTSYDNIGKWKAEIQAVEPNKPIVLFSTKKDLREAKPDDAVSRAEFIDAKKNHGLHGFHETSAKEWQDFNVHKAFIKAINGAMEYKYGPSPADDE